MKYVGNFKLQIYIKLFSQPLLQVTAGPQTSTASAIIYKSHHMQVLQREKDLFCFSVAVIFFTCLNVLFILCFFSLCVDNVLGC